MYYDVLHPMKVKLLWKHFRTNMWIYKLKTLKNKINMKDNYEYLYGKCKNSIHFPNPKQNI